MFPFLKVIRDLFRGTKVNMVRTTEEERRKSYKPGVNLNASRRKRAKNTEVRRASERYPAYYYGLTAHGSQVNDINSFDTWFISLPPNVKVITITVPGQALYGNVKSFHIFYSMLKNLSSTCLETLFEDSVDGLEMRKFMTRIYENSGEFQNVSFRFYTGQCPEMILSTLNDSRTGIFTKYHKGNDPSVDKFIERPEELDSIQYTPDVFPFIFLKRRGKDAPASQFPALPTVDDMLKFKDMGFTEAEAWRATYASDDFDVDDSLMTRYFDTVFRLSTFIRQEYNRTRQQNFVVFACRTPLFFNVATRTLTQTPLPENIPRNAFIKAEKNRNKNSRYMNLNYDETQQNSRMLSSRCHPLYRY